MKRMISICLCVFLSFAGTFANASDLGVSIPLGAGFDQAQQDLCPQGVMVITQFLSAWAVEDYATMYALIDDKSKENYSYDDARFDFQFMEFREYEISAVRKRGDDFEFFLSFGDWQSGDKELKKVMVDGKTFQIKMASNSSVFKKSADSYF